MINSNQDSDNNHLKMLLIVELPHNYPNEAIPFMRLKNLSSEFLDNRMLDEYESEIRKKAHESLGMQMIFEMCEHLREQISNINESVLNQYEEIQKKREEQDALDAGPRVSKLDHLNYTPVTKETFAAWCDDFLEKLRLQEKNSMTEQDLRKTGKELFMENQGEAEIEDLTLNEEEAQQIIANEEGDKDSESEEEKEGALYDKELFAQELGDDDDVDFD